MERKYREKINELDRTIANMRAALASFQSSYKKLSDDVNGVEIDPLEYPYLNLGLDDDIDGEPID